MWSLFSSSNKVKPYQEVKEEEPILMSGGNLGTSTVPIAERIKDNLKAAKKEEIKVASIFLRKKEKMLKEFPDLKIEPADRLEVPQNFEMATLKGALELLEQFRENKVKSQEQGVPKKPKEVKPDRSSKRAEAQATAASQLAEAKKIIAPIIEQNKTLRADREGLEISNEELRGKVSFLTKQLDQYERESKALSIKNDHLEQQLTNQEHREKEVLKMTTQEVRLYERKNLNLLRQNRQLKEEIERLNEQINDMRLKSLNKAKSKIDEEVKAEKSSPPRLEERKSSRVIVEEEKKQLQEVNREQPSTLLGKFMKADRKKLFNVFAQFLEIPDLMNLRLINRQLNVLFQVSPRIWLPIMKIRIESKIKKMHEIVHQNWTDDPKLKELVNLFLSGKYKTGGHFEQCIFETQKFISEKLGYLRRRAEENSMGAELAEISQTQEQKNPQKRKQSLMNSLSSIFKKKKKDQPTPVMPRKIEEIPEKTEQAKEAQDVPENKSTSQSVESSSEENKSNRPLKPRVSTSNRSSFLSTTSGDDTFEMLQFRSVPDIMGYLESIEQLLSNKVEVADWLKDLRKYYANLIVYSKYCLYDIQRLERVKIILKSRVEEVELRNVDLKDQRDEFQMRLKAHEKLKTELAHKIRNLSRVNLEKSVELVACQKQLSTEQKNLHELQGEFQGIQKHSEKVLKLFTKEIKRTSQTNESLRKRNIELEDKFKELKKFFSK